MPRGLWKLLLNYDEILAKTNQSPSDWTEWDKLHVYGKNQQAAYNIITPIK